MPNIQSHHKILEKLRIDEDTKVIRDDLEKILEEELSKPEAQVDSALIDELLDLLEEETPPEDVLKNAWKEIEKKRKKKPQGGSVLKRCALTAAAVVILFVLSFQTAQAFRWTFLLKLLQPMAETFGIYTESNHQPSISNSHDDAYRDADTEFSQQSFASLEEMPTEIDGYKIIPGGVPARFSFFQGTLYADEDTTNISIAYRTDEENLLFTAVLFHHDEAVSGIEFEQTSSSVETMEGVGDLSFYYNKRGEVQSVSWIVRNMHYLVYGDATKEEMLRIVENFR